MKMASHTTTIIWLYAVLSFIVTYRIAYAYNLEIDFSLNLKKTGSNLAILNCYFTSLIFCIFFPSAVFSQLNGSSRLNLITSTLPVQATLSYKNKYASAGTPVGYTNSNYQNSGDPPVLVSNCGEGGTAYNPPATPSTEPGGTAVSPNTKVLNPEMAYDASETTYSTIYMDQQQKGVELAQYILFSNPASAGDKVKLKMSLTGDLLNDNDYTVTLQGFMGTTGVGTAVPITTGLTNDQYEYYITPGAVFDRIKINILTNTNGSKKAQVNVHYVTLTTPPTPSFPGTTVTGGVSSSSESHCEGNITLSVSNPDAAYVYKWYNSSNTLLTTGSAYSTLLTPGTYTYYVSASRGVSCPESAKHTINLTINPKPTTPAIALTN